MGFDRKTLKLCPLKNMISERTKHHSFFYWKILEICSKNTHFVASSLLLKEILYLTCIINSPNFMEWGKATRAEGPKPHHIAREKSMTTLLGSSPNLMEGFEGGSKKLLVVPSSSLKCKLIHYFLVLF
jgi:hypothetical protein